MLPYWLRLLVLLGYSVHPVVYCLAVVRVEKESSLTSVTASACIQNNTVHYIVFHNSIQLCNIES